MCHGTTCHVTDFRPNWKSVLAWLKLQYPTVFVDGSWLGIGASTIDFCGSRLKCKVVHRKLDTIGVDSWKALQSIWEVVTKFAVNFWQNRLKFWGTQLLVVLWMYPIWHYSNLPLKYASQLSAQICWQKLGFILYCLNMSCRVICHECMNLLIENQCQFVKVSMKRLKQLLQFIICLFILCLNIGAKQLVVDVEDNVV